MFRARAPWVRFAKRSKAVQTRPFGTTMTNNSNTTKPTSNNNSNTSEKNVVESNTDSYEETYKQLDKLDFATAAKILFTDPPKKKKFGMEAELEQKKKQEEEEKAKEMELNDTEGKAAGSDPEILEVKVRLDKLEEAVKGIVVETKKQSVCSVAKNQEDGTEKKVLATTEPTDTKSRPEANNVDKQESVGLRPGLGQERVSGSAPVPDASLHSQKGKTQN